MHYLFDRTKTLMGEAIAAAERARKERIAALDEYIAHHTKDLEAAREQVRTLPETLGKLSAERARLEATTGAAIVAEMLKPAEPAPAPEEPFVPGLPDARLRAVWAEWETNDGSSNLTFGRICGEERYIWQGTGKSYALTQWGAAPIRPAGTTWANVRRLADEAEKAKAPDPASPELLDLRTLPAGTVCEATGEIKVPCTDMIVCEGGLMTIKGTIVW